MKVLTVENVKKVYGRSSGGSVSKAFILADEPTGALDSKSSRELLGCMSELNKEQDATILMVTHDAFAASFCRRIIFIKDGELFTEIRSSECRQFFK